MEWVHRLWKIASGQRGTKRENLASEFQNTLRSYRVQDRVRLARGRHPPMGRALLVQSVCFNSVKETSNTKGMVCSKQSKNDWIAMGKRKPASFLWVCLCVCGFLFVVVLFFVVVFLNAGKSNGSELKSICCS